ncbi:TRAP transporter substrate-binding protein [Rhodothermus marinus]|uniref:TRAP dicarboxylate transporter-DctP subunit n=1 Tax=Rhodothermus marinus (strain ATCC 43812 / DSM 4252 / R-10) TaxID=518766 RepID=D0MG27_RHOM4|nr:TRAP transporter substrate-binding protein [Rhodothermus marinus]ACY49516.1 TRAP dicarboxylate transporter- DctP subunit [Rhodothermus marinus DSM 4252]
MERRRFLKKAALGAAATAVLAGCGNRQTDEGGAPAVQTLPRLRWRLASSFPRGLDTIYGAAEVLAERVRALTDGRFEIRVYPAGELVPGLQVLDAVQNGTVPIGHTASYYFIGKHPALAFDCTVPFGLTARQYNAWLLEGGGLDLLRELFAEFNIVNLPGGNTGAQMGGWFRREINSLRDLRGLKMRIPGMGGRVMSEMGVTVQVLAGGEIYPALERGAIDAAEWAGPYDDEKLGFYQIAPYYYYPGWWEPGPALTFYVNRREWERLPSFYREVLWTAALEASQTMVARYDARNPAALQRLLQAGVQLRRFPDDVLREAARIAEELLGQEQDPLYRKIYEAYRKWRAQSYRWFGTTELAYAQFAFQLPSFLEV